MVEAAYNPFEHFGQVTTRQGESEVASVIWKARCAREADEAGGKMGVVHD